MVHDFPSSNAKAKAPGFRVEAPRECDAIGMALRGAFDRDLGVPEDMAAMLAKLNLPEPHSSY